MGDNQQKHGRRHAGDRSRGNFKAMTSLPARLASSASGSDDDSCEAISLVDETLAFVPIGRGTEEPY